MGGEAIEKIITVQLLTDSKSLFRVISKDSRTSEERLMLEIAEAGDRVREKAIFDIGFVRSSSIPPTASRNKFRRQVFSLLSSVDICAADRSSESSAFRRQNQLFHFRFNELYYIYFIISL